MEKISCAPVQWKVISPFKGTIGQGPSPGGCFQTSYTGQAIPSELRSPVNAMNLLKYRSGEEIRKGDRVLFHGHPAEIELVAYDPSDPEATWHLSEYGAGVLVSDPKVFVRAFIPSDQLDEYEDLEFVSRAGS